MKSTVSPSRLLWFNTLFDISLSGEDVSRHADAGAALSVSALPCCRPGDAAILDADVSDEYLSWLGSFGFSPRVARQGEDFSGFDPVPWGWDGAAASLFESFGCAGEHPPFDAASRANSREFSNEVARAVHSASAGTAAADAASLTALLSRCAFPVVVKPCFGSAGSGFTLVTDAASAKRAVDRGRVYFGRNIPVSVEPWLERLEDYSANFTVKNGYVDCFTCHRAFIDKKGIFRGIEIGGVPDDISAPLRHAAEVSARALGSIGYFGPAGIDAFTYADGGSVRFNPVCEINARLTMGEVARSLHAVLGGRYGRMLLVVTGGADLPCGMRGLSELFGRDAFDRATKRGIFPATPVYLSRGGETLKVRRFVVYVAGDSSAECDGFEVRMREILTALRPRSGA